MRTRRAKKIFQGIIFIAVVAVAVAAHSALAAGNCGSIPFIPSLGIPGSPFLSNVPVNVDCTSIGTYIKSVYTFSIYVAGVVAAIMLMVGGFLWLTAGGNANQV